MSEFEEEINPPAMELTAGSKIRPIHSLLIMVVLIPSMDSTSHSALIATSYDTNNYDLEVLYEGTR